MVGEIVKIPEKESNYFREQFYIFNYITFFNA